MSSLQSLPGQRLLVATHTAQPSADLQGPAGFAKRLLDPQTAARQLRRGNLQ